VVSSTLRPLFTSGIEPVPILQEAGWAPGPVWTGGKSRPHRDSIPDRPARSSVTIATELPGPPALSLSLSLYIYIYIYIKLQISVFCENEYVSAQTYEDFFTKFFPCVTLEVYSILVTTCCDNNSFFFTAVCRNFKTFSCLQYGLNICTWQTHTRLSGSASIHFSCHGP